MADDLSDLMDDDATEGEGMGDKPTALQPGEMAYPDRIFVLNEYAKGERTTDKDVEYIRADAIRDGFTAAIWREAARYAQRTAGQPGGALRKVRDLIEENR